MTWRTAGAERVRKANSTHTSIFKTPLPYLVLLALAFIDPGRYLEDKPNRLVILDLRYDDGIVYQHVQPLLGYAMYARWDAQITRNGRRICSGFGTDEYERKPEALPLPIAAWVGDPDCILEPGEPHTASATWTYYDNDGQPMQVSGTFAFLSPSS